MFLNRTIELLDIAVTKTHPEEVRLWVGRICGHIELLGLCCSTLPDQGVLSRVEEMANAALKAATSQEALDHLRSIKIVHEAYFTSDETVLDSDFCWES